MHSPEIAKRLITLFAVTAAVTFIFSSSGCSTGDVVYERMRSAMVRDQVEARGITDEAVLAAMLSVPRHLFVPKELMGMAYIDSPLPIGREQTISQPYIVGLMTSALSLSRDAKVLEIGTGSGYQAAVLSRIVDSVFTIEIIPELAAQASIRLDSLGYRNVKVMAGDGYDGWPKEAPFDGIIVTAAAPRIPGKLVEQLGVGGRMVIPVGRFPQSLNVYEKTQSGLELLSSTPVRFVPMTGKISEEKGK